MSGPTDDEYFELGPAQRKCDPLLFIESLLPRSDSDSSKASTPSGKKKAHGCSTSIVETITVINGTIRAWLYTSHEGVIVDRKHYDRTSIIASWRQHALSLSPSSSQQTAVVRRTDKNIDVLDVDQMVAFVKRLDDELPTVDLIQKFIPSRGNDRSIYRVHYSRPPKTEPTIETITRHPEFISAERAERSEFMPIASFNESINAALENSTMKVLRHVEDRLRVRIHKALLDFIVDTAGNPHFFFASEIFMSDAVGQPAFAIRAAAAMESTAPPSPRATSTERTEWTVPTLDTRLQDTLTNGSPGLISPTLFGMRIGDGARGEILLVDNDEASCSLAAKALVSEGYVVTVIDDGAQALSTSRAGVFDCLVVARDLKSLSGLEVARILRQRELNSLGTLTDADRLPIIIFTDRTTPEDLKMYQDTGFSGCISKPFEAAAFLKTVGMAVPRPSRSRGMVRTATLPSSSLLHKRDAGNFANTAESAFPIVSSTGLGPESKGPEGEPTSRSFTSRSNKVKSPYQLPVATTGKKPSKVAPAVPASPTRQPTTMTIAVNEKRESSGADLGKVAPPVTSGPHGGRIGMGAGSKPHKTSEVGAPRGKGPGADHICIDTFRLDAETEIPYCVLGKSRDSSSFFHLILIHDIFDTYERYQLLLERLATALPGLKVLLFNYPGQAYTQYRKDVVLNNEYHAGVLQALLVHLGPAGTGSFTFDNGKAPFFVLGYGNGASIGSAFVARYADVYPNLRGLVLINGFITPDAHVAGVLHDSINVFSCSPPQRPDLPIYFFARYLFCAPYLEKVGAPLALNMYTAVANPITLDGRIALCHGALSHANVIPDLNKMEIPMIGVSSVRDTFIKPTHTRAIAKTRGGEARSIRRTLYSKRQMAVIELPAGHEVFQECKQTMLNLIVQLVTGYHEKNDVAFVPMEEHEISLLSPEADVLAASKAGGALSKSKVKSVSTAAANQKHLLGETTKGALMLEDRFLDHVVASMRNPAALAPFAEDPIALLNMSSSGISSAPGSIPLIPAAAASAFTPRAMHNPHLAKSAVLHSLMPETKVGSSGMLSLQSTAQPVVSGTTNRHGQFKPSASTSGTDLKRSLPPLRRLDNDEVISTASKMAKLGNHLNQTDNASGNDHSFRLSEGLQASMAEGAGQTNKAAPLDSHYTAAAQEYMKWRVIRNRRRLQRIEACAISIQRAWRQFLARTAVKRIVEHRAALDIQRFWRGCMGRSYANEVRRIITAVKGVQRVYRGHLVRKIARRLRLEHAAAAEIQRIWKGHTVRKYISAMKQRFLDAAIRVQCTWRRFAALKELVRRRIERVAAVTAQRLIRGFLARRRAMRERERFLFSKSQAQGIEFGRQLLMEHKLKGTRLQSEVSTLTREKVVTEEDIHALLTEVSALEQAVRQLEKDMAKLSKMDAQVALAMDDQARMELRENKIRLDKEFASMLEKITDRKSKLGILENKLQSLDRARESKQGELKDLERKLVILLEQQQSELQAIRHRQERRGENLIEDAVQAVKDVMANPQSAAQGERRYALEDVARRGPAALALRDKDPIASALLTTGGFNRQNGGHGDTIDFDDLPSMNSTRRPGPTHGAGDSGPTPQQRAEAAALMASTETMMKFGFMAMSMTYFSSLNMVKSMKQLGTANTMLASNPMLQAVATYGAAGMAGMPQIGGLSQMNGSSAMNFKSSDGVDGSVDVKSWTVADVGAWLEVLTLAQYKDAFAEAAIDGAFLVELDEEDLQNALGIEHPLHRKKIVAAIVRLQREQAERQAIEAAKSAAAIAALRGETPPQALPASGSLPALADAAPAQALARSAPTASVTSALLSDATAKEKKEREAMQRQADRDAGFHKIDELISWIRHDKIKQLSDALSPLTDMGFDKRLVSRQFVPEAGTEYVTSLRGPAFHINKADDKGNTLLIVAAQNNRLKIAQLLVKKGANPDHQNALGNTAMHYAMAYRFNDMAAWLVHPEKGGASDELRNVHDLDPYEGLEP